MASARTVSSSSATRWARAATSVMDKVGARIEALLVESPRWTGGKQRPTATRLHTLLLAEGFEVGITTVKEAVVAWKRQRREVFLPLVYPAGDLAQVDFFEVLVDLRGERQKMWIFVMRLMHSGSDFAGLYSRQDQVCFLEGHVRAFAHFGFVPQRIAYDNLKAAVAKHLIGSERVLASRFEALASHYLFEACFCRPRTGHDKGGVESRGKAIRCNTSSPSPRGQWIDRAENVILAGPIGTGKTHLAIALGIEAARQRRRVVFARAADTVRSLLEARDARELGRLQRRLNQADLLILDELGFVPFDRAGGELLFNMLTERYERRSVLITTNLAFGEWVKIFGGDEKLTTALLDRLAHHATVIPTKGRSYRMRKKGMTDQREDESPASTLPKTTRKA